MLSVFILISTNYGTLAEETCACGTNSNVTLVPIHISGFFPESKADGRYDESGNKRKLVKTRSNCLS